MNLVGKTIGNRYEILKKSGSGGMATVYMAKDTILNRTVAVKVLKDEYTTDAEFIKRFNAEAQSAAGLSHANIVSIYDVGKEEDDDIYYIVMEYIKGKTLKEIINKEDGALSWKWAINIAIQIAQALDTAHKNGIVHRDIKPHNIIITEDGTAKVTDFGIAKAVSNSTMTAFGTTIGSVHYFSPEQAKGSITDARSDIYSLGVVMYEMFTGKVPFDADTPVSVALKHMQEEPEQPKKVNSKVPLAINDIIMKAMEKDPIDRYQTASAIERDLKKALKDPNGDFVRKEPKGEDEGTMVMDSLEDEEIITKKKGFFNKHPKTKIPVIILGAIILFIIVFGATRLILNGNMNKKIDIPNLKGKTLQEATIITDNDKLLIESEEIASNDVEVGKIISQDPDSNGSKIEQGQKIKVKVSKGPESTKLPSFENIFIEEARKKAEELGLKLVEVTENSDTVKESMIISQTPEEGTEVKSGDSVTVKVSAGVKKTIVPMVTGMNEGTAVATLTNSNLKSKVTYQEDTTKTNGEVLTQSITQGTEVSEGTTIELVINKIEEKSKDLTLKIKLPSKASQKNNTTTNSLTTSIDVDENVQVLVNGTIIDNTKRKAGSNFDIKTTIKGGGSKKFSVNVDGEEIISQTINMDNFVGDTIYLEKN